MHQNKCCFVWFSSTAQIPPILRNYLERVVRLQDYLLPCPDSDYIISLWADETRPQICYRLTVCMPVAHLYNLFNKFCQKATRLLTHLKLWKVPKYKTATKLSLNVFHSSCDCGENVKPTNDDTRIDKYQYFFTKLCTVTRQITKVNIFQNNYVLKNSLCHWNVGPPEANIRQPSFFVCLLPLTFNIST